MQAPDTDFETARTTAAELTRIAMVVREEVKNEWHARSCIATTRVLIETLNYFGHRATPQPVSVAVFNAEGFRVATETPDLPLEQWPAGAWSVGTSGTGRLNERGDWDGHLVALLSEGAQHWLIDGSLDQLSRPARGIELDPFAFHLNQAWTGQATRWSSGDGNVLVYRDTENPGPWRQATDWKQRKALVQRVAGHAIRRLREQGA